MIDWAKLSYTLLFFNVDKNIKVGVAKISSQEYIKVNKTLCDQKVHS